MHVTSPLGQSFHFQVSESSHEHCGGKISPDYFKICTKKKVGTLKKNEPMMLFPEDFGTLSRPRAPRELRSPKIMHLVLGSYSLEGNFLR